MKILAVDDVFYRPAHFLSSISSIHLNSAIAALTMTAVAIIGLYFRPKAQLFNRLGWPSVALLVIFFVNAFVMYVSGDT